MSLESRLRELETKRDRKGAWGRPIFIKYLGEKESRRAQYGDQRWERGAAESEDQFLDRIESELHAAGQPAPCVWINHFAPDRDLTSSALRPR